jgi:multidrug resistance efflux pump
MNVISRIKKRVGLLAISALTISGFFYCNMACAETVNPKAIPIITAVEGNITLYVEVGQKVKEGEPLFFVDQVDAALAQNLELAKIDAKFAKLTYKRKLKLSKSHNVSEQELQDSLCAYKEALVNIKINETKLKYNMYRAPFNCVVTKIIAVNGAGFGDGNPVLEVNKA